MKETRIEDYKTLSGQVIKNVPTIYYIDKEDMPCHSLTTCKTLSRMMKDYRAGEIETLDYQEYVKKEERYGRLQR